jgi:hypothetical protein
LTANTHANGMPTSVRHSRLWQRYDFSFATGQDTLRR